MTYRTTITSKGTITIAAPLRKALGLRPGQKVSLSLNHDNQLVVSTATDMKRFAARRAEITRKIPPHLKGLSGDSLRAAAAGAWATDGHD